MEGKKTGFRVILKHLAIYILTLVVFKREKTQANGMQIGTCFVNSMKNFLKQI